MNGRTAKLIRRLALRLPGRVRGPSVKADWNSKTAQERGEMREQIKRALQPKPKKGK